MDCSSATHLGVAGQNNLQRKRVYQACAIKLGYTFRAPLPHCVVAAVRTAWPSANGHYMGYKPKAGSNDGSDSSGGFSLGSSDEDEAGLGVFGMADVGAADTGGSGAAQHQFSGFGRTAT